MYNNPSLYLHLYIFSSRSRAGGKVDMNCALCNLYILRDLSRRTRVHCPHLGAREIQLCARMFTAARQFASNCTETPSCPRATVVHARLWKGTTLTKIRKKRVVSRTQQIGCHSPTTPNISCYYIAPRGGYPHKRLVIHRIVAVFHRLLYIIKILPSPQDSQK